MEKLRVILEGLVFIKGVCALALRDIVVAAILEVGLLLMVIEDKHIIRGTCHLPNPRDAEAGSLHEEEHLLLGGLEEGLENISLGLGEGAPLIQLNDLEYLEVLSLASIDLDETHEVCEEGGRYLGAQLVVVGEQLAD